MGGVGGMLAWVTWVASLGGWRAYVGDVLALVACLRGWRACVGGVLAWVAC